MVGKSKTRHEVGSVSHQGAVYKAGDCVLINPDANAPAYVAKIKRLFQISADPQDVELEVSWFYRPEEAVGGRKAFHGVAEIFDSDHVDKAHKNAIMGPCNVMTIKNYEMRKVRSENDFYCRFKYKPKTKEFEPDAVPVYCRCELPYNPDRPMAVCSGCGEWYHPSCLNLGDDALELEHFMCNDCAAKRAATAAAAEDEPPRKKLAVGPAKR